MHRDFRVGPLAAAAAAIGMVSTSALAATFYSQEPGFISRGEVQAAFGLTAKETEAALVSIQRAILYQDVTYTVTCEWVSSSGVPMQKSVDRHLIYKSELYVVPDYAGFKNYTGLRLVGGTGNIEFIQDANLSFPNNLCPADAGMLTDDPAEFGATVKSVEEPFGTRISEISISYGAMTRTLHTVAPEYNHPYRP